MAREPRLAALEDLTAIRELIPLSVRGLNAGLYTSEQLDASLEHVFGADTQVIRDQTYFVVEDEGRLIACGGWSRRKTLYGGDQLKQTVDPLLDPSIDAARIRAFFAHPNFARQGLGRLILNRCMAAVRSAGFRSVELGSTLPGVALYRAYGFEVVERLNQPMPGGLFFPIVRMKMTVRDD